MNITTAIRFVCFATLLFAAGFQVAAQNTFTDVEADSIKTFLHGNFDGRNIGMVIGLVDEHGSRIFGAGRLDNGTSQEVNGDTVFEIGSVTKTFTALLLQDMVERGEMKLDDPVSMYLPKSVKMPTRNGNEITVLHLATHTSGLPEFPNNFSPGDVNRAYSGYTVERMYAFLSGFTLTRAPGMKWEYSNVGMALLEHAIALKAGTNYESLVVERICRPLQMDSTRITLTDLLKSRIAKGHDRGGHPLPNQEFLAMTGASALRSTGNDLLKYISANIGLTQSSLTSLMEKTHATRNSAPPKHRNTAMDWYDHGIDQPQEMLLLGHGGQTVGYNAFIGFDNEKRRGVVVLFNQQTAGGLQADSVGWLLLEGVRLTPQIASVLLTGNNNELVGIGVKLDFDVASHMLKVAEVFPDSPASQAGLPAGVIVRTIDGAPTTDKSMTECISLIRGKSGTKVRLELVTSDRSKTNTIEITRAKFQVANR